VSAAVTELLAQLVDVTAMPPVADDPERVLAAFDAMLATRAALLRQLEVATPAAFTPHGRDLADELSRRDQAWIAALGLARQAVADRLTAVRRAQRRS
jgi:hypothetical protein